MKAKRFKIQNIVISVAFAIMMLIGLNQVFAETDSAHPSIYFDAHPVGPGTPTPKPPKSTTHAINGCQGDGTITTRWPAPSEFDH
jgi:hypothetical protein